MANGSLIREPYSVFEQGRKEAPFCRQDDFSPYSVGCLSFICIFAG